MRPKHRREPLHEDLLAAMTLGTWRFMLPGRKDAGKQLLWEQALSSAFPNLKRPVHELEHAVEGVHRLRNRVAHLEPLINSRIEAQLANMRTVIGAIDQDMLSWFASVEGRPDTEGPAPGPKQTLRPATPGIGWSRERCDESAKVQYGSGTGWLAFCWSFCMGAALGSPRQHQTCWTQQKIIGGQRGPGRARSAAIWHPA